jgi:large subunit ribosomal protein L18
MKALELKQKRRIRRKYGIRKKISGTAEFPRLTIFRSLTGIYAQIVDDTKGITLVSASTLDKEIKSMIKPGMPKIAQSEVVGEMLAKRALALNINRIAFDRNGFLYHGRVKALADGCRKGGLQF